MNPRAFDLIIRSVTTALLALGVMAVVAYQAVHGTPVDAQLGGAFLLIIGVYFGAHVSQNGASARSRAEALAIEAVTGTPAPRDPLARSSPPSDK